MFNKKYAVLLAVILVIFVGMAVAMVHNSLPMDMVAFDFFVPNGHICGSVCTG